MPYPICKSTAFVFVCQRGPLEVESVLLAASLKQCLRGEYELIAAVPTPAESFGTPQEPTFRLLRALGVRIVAFENTILQERPAGGGPFLLTNKIFCLRVSTQAEKLVFLDSDQLCRREFNPAPLLRTPLSARKADFVSSNDMVDVWDAVFRAADAEPPQLRVRILKTKDPGEQIVYTPPSFNSSFVAIDASLAAEFSRLWESTFRQIDRSGVMRRVHYYQEQASLAVAAHKSGLAYEMLETRWINPHLAHYFRPSRVQENAELSGVARSLAGKHNEIKEIARDFPEWQFLCD